jgi:putative ABC transport system permease protein
MRVGKIIDGLKAMFRRREADRELDDEVRGFVEEAAREKMKRGVDRNEALREARLELGGVENVKEQVRAFGWEAMAGNLWQDVKFGARMIAKNPGFAAVAVIALALGIGADTAMYTIVSGAFTWKMGLDDPGRIVLVTSVDQTGKGDFFGASYPDFLDFRSQTRSLAGLAAYRMNPVNLSDSSALPDMYQCVEMSANGFSVVGQRPLLGRDFRASDEQPGAPPVLMIAYHVWRDRYALDPGIVGRVVRVDAVPRVVIGVMPPDRRFPEDTDLWAPLLPTAEIEKRENRSLFLFGELSDGSSLARARAEFTTLSHDLATQYGDTDKDITADVEPILTITGLYLMRPLFYVLFAAVGFVLLIACGDVANMLLARTATRRREMSIRIALGAGRISLVRQLLVESVLLSAAGGLFGWMIAIVGLRLFDSGIGSMQKPTWLHLTQDRQALLYLGAISIATGIVFGLMPALRLSRTSPIEAIKEDGGAISGKRGLRTSNALVGFQMALCVVLLVAAGLLIRSAVKLYDAPIGINTKNILTMRLTLPAAQYPSAQTWVAFHEDLEKRLAAVPGVEAAGMASNLPLGGWISFSVELQSKPGNAEQEQIGGIVASNNYFRLMKIHPIRGRVFNESDGRSGPAVVIVNEAFAAEFWPGEDVLGKRIRVTGSASTAQWLTIVGIVPNVLQNRRDSLRHDSLIYVPFVEQPQQEMFLMARTAVPPATLIESFRREVQQEDPNLAVYEVRTLEQRIAEARLTVNMLGAICSVFAGIATLLAAVGLYGVIAHAVSQRHRELGVRMALGASRSDIGKLVLRQASPPLVAGLAIGIVAAIGLAHVLRSVLVGVTSMDPASFGGAVIVLLLAAFLGGAVPARRAMRVDPMVALRHE